MAVAGALDHVLTDVERTFGDDARAIPRTGLGGSLVLHVAGARGGRKARRAAATAIEAWNQRVHRGDVDDALTRALAHDARALVHAWSRWVKDGDAQLRAVVDRLLPAWRTELEIPESVAFLRAAVAAAIAASRGSDDEHAALDAWATWTGLAWEARGGTLRSHGWHGALSAIGLDAAWDEREAERIAATRAEHIASTLEPRLVGALSGLSSASASQRREPRALVPGVVPRVARASAPRRAERPLERFAHAHAASIDAALYALADARTPHLARAIEFLVAQGGKRLRALFVLAATQAAGGDPTWAAREAAAVEWLHRASLVVDDVLDRATLRRGQPALHHATSVPFAAGVALHLLAAIERALRASPRQSRALLADAAATLAEGEWSELRTTGDPRATRTTYYRVIEAKTARLFSAAMALGGVVAGAPERQIKALARAGREAGLAFQIIDDLLDVTGDAELLGKAPGTDLVARKPTLPLLELRARGTDADRASVERWLREGPRDASAELSHLRARLSETGADEACRAVARAHASRAREAIAVLPDASGRELCTALVDASVERAR